MYQDQRDARYSAILENMSSQTYDLHWRAATRWNMLNGPRHTWRWTSKWYCLPMSAEQLSNGPNGWSKGWVGNDRHRPLKLRRQPGGGGVVLLAGIIGSELVGPWRVLEGVKLTAETYINFLKNNFAPWYIRKLLALKRKMIFMQDNAPSNVTKKTGEYLIRVGFKNGRPM